MDKIPSHLSNLDEIITTKSPNEKNFELIYYFNHNLQSLTKSQIVQICQHNTSNHDKMTMVESIIDNKVEHLFSSLSIIIRNISDQEIQNCCLFAIADAKIIKDDHFVLLHDCVQSEVWKMNVRYQYSKNHTKSEVEKFYQMISYYPPPIFTSPTFYETPEGRKAGIVSKRNLVK